MSSTEKHAFQAEVSQVLSLVVNSLYSNKEIFLRELVSNASDALDKLRFRALSEKGLLADGEELKIRISADEAAGTLTIADNGVGMSEQELIDNLGTIARSGTREFSQMLAQAAEAKQSGAQLIGQFGVGFYSAYLVADRVAVVSRAAGSADAFQWESDAKESFTVVPAEREEHGTTITLFLKEEQKEYASEYRIKDVIRRHSDYVGHPIELLVERPSSESDEDAEKKEDVAPKKEFEVINQANALWQRSPKDVTLEQYQEFYKHLSHDWSDPVAHKHFKIEGTQMFSGIVFLPKEAKADLLDPRGEHGVRLHVRRVLAMESCEELLPKWLRFVRGVVDSEDLPLNVSRETLQDSKVVRVMKKQVVSQVLTMIEELEKEHPEEYLSFYEQFGSVLKEGLYFEPESSERLSRLLRFHSTHGDAKAWVSLSEYVARMKEDQPGIYFVEGQSVEVLQQGPHLEQLKKHGFEVLFMIDGVDPFALERLTEFAGKKLLNAMKESLDLGEPEAEEAEEEKGKRADFVSKFKQVLGDIVADVRTSRRLAESPACLVTAEGGLPPHMEAMFRAQNLSIPPQKRILELNQEHPVVINLQRLAESRADSPEVKEWMELLYDQALIAEGSQVQDSARLAKRLTSLLASVSTRAASEL